MPKGFITCPKCGADFELSQAVSRDMEQEIVQRYANKIKEMENSLRRESEEREKIFQKTLTEAEEKAKKKAESQIGLELKDLKIQLKEKEEAIHRAQEEELELRKRQRALEQREKALELETSRRLDVEIKKAKEEAFKSYEEERRFKDAEKDKQLVDMRRQIDELKRKAEQGSQKIQGEILELELEHMLKEEFPFDDIEPVSSGIRGADIIQNVKTQSGKPCGRILWETKRTKAWSDKWLQKLKDDQRQAKADIAVIVSEVLPQGLLDFRQIEGVWITSVLSASSLALALRVILIQVAREKRLQEGRSGKMELVYNYLTGSEFKNRVEAIIESFVSMKADLDREKRAMNKIWEKRDKQIERVITNIGGMQGDIEGLSGVALPKIEKLELT
jgi:hypothetical protein